MGSTVSEGFPNEFSLYTGYSNIYARYYWFGDPDYIRCGSLCKCPLLFDVVGSIDDNQINQYSSKSRPRCIFARGHPSEYNKSIQRKCRWYQEPTFVVKASDITDTLSIRLKNISIFLVQKDRRGRNNFVSLRGNNVIPVHINKI